MSSPAPLLFSLVRGASTLAALAAEVALLVAILVSVRRHRPDAVPILAASACAAIFATLASSVVYSLIPMITRGSESMFVFEAGVSAMLTLVRVASIVLLIVGLVRLAAPPRTATGLP
jgi:hypothetical protein